MSSERNDALTEPETLRVRNEHGRFVRGGVAPTRGNECDHKRPSSTAGGDVVEGRTRRSQHRRSCHGIAGCLRDLGARTSEGDVSHPDGGDTPADGVYSATLQAQQVEALGSDRCQASAGAGGRSPSAGTCARGGRGGVAGVCRAQGRAGGVGAPGDGVGVGENNYSVHSTGGVLGETSSFWEKRRTCGSGCAARIGSEGACSCSRVHPATCWRWRCS